MEGRYGDEEFDAYFNTRNGYRTINVEEDFARNDELTVYLLCDDCSGNQRFDGSIIADEEIFEIDVDTGRSNFENRYDRYDQDLALRDVSYEYYLSRNDVVVEIVSRIDNEGSDTIRLDELAYEVEVDNVRLSSRDFSIRHIDTDCDDSYVSSYDVRSIDIEEDDSCEIVVELLFDEDDVLYETMEIEITLDSSEDDDSSNDSESFRFYID